LCPSRGRCCRRPSRDRTSFAESAPRQRRTTRQGTERLISWQYLKHSINVGWTDVEMGGHADPAGARRGGNSGGAKAADQLLILEPRLPNTDNPRAGRRGSRTKQDFVALGGRAIGNPIAETLYHRRDGAHPYLQ